MMVRYKKKESGMKKNHKMKEIGEAALERSIRLGP